jgi:hypothetical protein
VRRLRARALPVRDVAGWGNALPNFEPDKPATKKRFGRRRTRTKGQNYKGPTGSTGEAS